MDGPSGPDGLATAACDVCTAPAISLGGQETSQSENVATSASDQLHTPSGGVNKTESDAADGDTSSSQPAELQALTLGATDDSTTPHSESQDGGSRPVSPVVPRRNTGTRSLMRAFNAAK